MSLSHRDQSIDLQSKFERDIDLRGILIVKGLKQMIIEKYLKSGILRYY